MIFLFVKHGASPFADKQNLDISWILMKSEINININNINYNIEY